jgi:hypothetical protein
MTNEGSSFPCLWCRRAIAKSADFFEIERTQPLGKFIQGMHWDCIYELARHWAGGGFGTDDLKGKKRPHHKFRGNQRG